MNIQPLISKIKKINASKFLLALVMISFFIIASFGTILILSDNECASCNVYKAIGFILIMLWICIFLCYFIWAIYYYNLNLGKTNAEWAKINDAKNNRTKGLPYDQKDIDEEPKYNPYKDETFGLPSGTVRGMIAFTLLFGSVAMLIVSFGMDNEMQMGTAWRDEFEFFKTAFLMMIAFYFGSRSLKLLKDNSTKKDETGNGTASSNNSFPDSPIPEQFTPAGPTPGSEVVFINEIEDVPTAEGIIPPIVPIDPMAPKKK